MAQEPQAQPLALVCALYDAGDVGNHKRAVVAVAHNAQTGFQGGECIVGNLGMGGAECGHQGRFAGIGETHQPDIGHNLELHNHPALFAGFAGLGIAGRLVGGTLEIVVAKAAAAAAPKDNLLPVFGDFAQQLARFCIAGHGAQRHLQDYVLAVGTGAEASAAGSAVVGFDMLLVLEVDQGPHLGVAAQDDMAATAAVTAVRATLGHIFFPAEVHTPRPSRARSTEDFHIVYEVAFCHNNAKILIIFDYSA